MVNNKKPEVLRRRSDFDRIRQNGKCQSVTRWLMVAHISQNEGHLRYAWTVSGKIGSAVVRNKLKRWCREYIRDLFKSGKNPELDINVIFRPQKDPQFYKSLRREQLVAALELFFKAR